MTRSASPAPRQSAELSASLKPLMRLGRQRVLVVMHPRLCRCRLESFAAKFWRLFSSGIFATPECRPIVIHAIRKPALLPTLLSQSVSNIASISIDV